MSDRTIEARARAHYAERLRTGAATVHEARRYLALFWPEDALAREALLRVLAVDPTGAIEPGLAMPNALGVADVEALVAGWDLESDARRDYLAAHLFASISVRADPSDRPSADERALRLVEGLPAELREDPDVAALRSALRSRLSASEGD